MKYSKLKVDDYRRLEEEASKSSSITIIGGGFLGSELAYSIKRKYDKMEVNQVRKRIIMVKRGDNYRLFLIMDLFHLFFLNIYRDMRMKR